MGEVAFREQHEGVVQQVRCFAGEGIARRRGRGDRVVLGRQQDLGRLFGHLAPDRVHAAVEERRRIGAGGAFRRTRGDGRPQGLEPGEALEVDRRRTSHGVIEVEARSRPAVTRRPDGIDRDQEGVAIAVRGDVDEPKDVAGRLALAPQPIARSRVEVDLPGLERGRQGLAVHMSDHQDPPVVGVLDHCGRQAVRADSERRRRRSCRGLRNDPDGEAGRRHGGLDRADRVKPTVEDRGRKDRVSTTVAYGGHEVVRSGGPT